MGVQKGLLDNEHPPSDVPHRSVKWIGLLSRDMPIEHSPEYEPREPRDDDIDVFESLQQGDVVSFFEWPVEPLRVLGREQDENVGERVRVRSEGDESFLYEVDGHLWHYVDEEKYDGENNPFPVQNLVRVDSPAT